MGVLSSWVTALRKLSWRSFRFTSRTRNMVFRTSPRDQQQEKGDANHQQDDAAPVDDDPANVEGDGKGDQASAESDGKNDRISASGDAHTRQALGKV